MRAQGSGNDVMMTAVPVIMLVLFIVFMMGGTESTLRWLEGFLRGGLEGLARLTS
jgi:hypothetical protein